MACAATWRLAADERLLNEAELRVRVKYMACSVVCLVLGVETPTMFPQNKLRKEIRNGADHSNLSGFVLLGWGDVEAYEGEGL